MPRPESHAHSQRLRQFAPLALAAAILALFFAVGGPSWISMEALRDNRTALVAVVQHHPLLTATLFVVVYTGLVAIAFPTTIVLTVAGGYLFGMVGAALSVCAATAGAVCLYFAARTALGDTLRSRFKGILARLEQGFHNNAFLYLLSLRLFPFAPFVAVTLAGAFFGAKPRAFALATALGTIPAAIIYTSIGAGAGTLIDQGGLVSLQGALLQPQVVGPLLAMAAMTAVPALWRTWRKGIEITPQ